MGILSRQSFSAVDENELTSGQRDVSDEYPQKVPLP